MTQLSEALQVALQYHRGNRLVEAEQVYRQILAGIPNQPDALYGLGMLAQQIGKYQSAEEFFNTTLLVNPESFKAWFSLGNLRQAQGQLSEAVEAYQRALALQPNSVALYNNFGYALQQQGKWENAIACYQKALEIQPNCAEADVNLGNALHAQGQLSQDKHAYYAALNHDLGVSRKIGGDVKTAVAYYRNAIAIQPELVNSHYTLGVALQEQGKLDDAIASYNNVLKLNPSNNEVYTTLVHNKLTRIDREQNKLNNKLNHQLNGADSKKRLKIAFVCQPFVMTSFPNPMDSIGILTYEFVRLLVQDGDVIVYTPGERFNTASHDGVDYRYIPIGRDKKLLNYLEKIPGFQNQKRPIFCSQLYYLAYILQVANDLRKQQCDVVHIHNLSQFIPVIRALNPGIKIALHMHCEWLTQLDHKILEKRLSKVDLVIGTSKYITEGIRQRFPKFAERCQPVFNGVNLDRFMNFYVSHNQQNGSTKNPAKRLLYVGRVSPEKGSHVLLEAFKKVLERCPQTKLDLVGPVGALPYDYLVGLSDDSKVAELASFYGDESWTGYVRRYLSELNDHFGADLASQVSFTGSLPQSKLVNYYQQADIFVFPSVCHEAFGMPIVEAMVAGLPVIATQAGAFPEIVEDGKTGLLVERSNADALADAILQLLSDQELKTSMGQAGHQRAVELFSFEKVVDDLLTQYKTIL
ncbi:glycosyltransferase [Moorena sp. SIO3I6]|uniref:glycosyltransferase n=1 Tax=Moorena sp. SIO3I6 TaxID=2607831 RepID=UPI0025FB40C3|nr:glycosyltransferase [Moorena sp. SIO3I6]